MLKINEQTVLIHAPPLFVWDAVCDMPRWNQWNSVIHQVDLLETLKVGAIGRIQTTRAASYPFKIMRIVPPALLTWQRDYEMGTVLVHTYTVARSTGGSIFTAAQFCDGRWAKVVTGIMRRRFTCDLETLGVRFQEFCENRWRKEKRLNSLRQLQDDFQMNEKIF